MENIIKFLIEISKHPLFGFYTFIFGVVFTFIVGYFSYKKTNKTKQPRILKRSISLINNYQSKLSKLNITYDNKPIEKLVITRIALWNEGKGTLIKNDITSTEPLAIKSSDNYKIFDFKLFHVVEETNNINIVYDKTNDKYIIDFEYLDINQGCIIDVYHDGENSSDIKITGKFKGCSIKEIKDNWLSEMSISSSGFFYKLFMLFATIVPSLFCFFAAITAFSEKQFFGGSIFLFCVFFFIFLCYLTLRRIVPKSFKIFDERIV